MDDLQTANFVLLLYCLLSPAQALGGAVSMAWPTSPFSRQDQGLAGWLSKKGIATSITLHVGKD